MEKTIKMTPFRLLSTAVVYKERS